MNAKRKFVFVVNDDASVAAVETGSTEETLHNSTIASVALNDNDTADKLASEENGIAMSGTATSDGVNEVITVTPGLKCQVKLKRIVARIDIQNDTPNMTLESAVLVKAAKQGYIFPQTAIEAPTEERLTLGSNAKVDITAQHPVLGPDDVFAPKTFNKVFYTYERPNTTEDYAAVRIAYRVNDSKGTIEVPFIRTELGGQQTPVDITRNNLYTIVLGNGEPVETNPLTFSIKVEEWNVVEMPEEIGPGVDQLDPSSQATLNAKLKVNMFTEYNAKTFDINDKTISEFYNTNKLTPAEIDPASKVSFDDLQSAGAVANDAIFTGPAGQGKYRIPTEGEIGLLVPLWTSTSSHSDATQNEKLHPWWNDNASSLQSTMIQTWFTETFYMKNDVSGYPDTTQPANSEYTLSGLSIMKAGALTEVVEKQVQNKPVSYNMHPVYALRFKGTDQYAAYRWESCPIADEPLERYFSIKIKALAPGDTTTTIDDVANEAFWQDGSIEFTLPCIGGGGAANGISAYFWGSSLRDDYAVCLGSSLFDIATFRDPKTSQFSLRFVKVE